MRNPRRTAALVAAICSLCSVSVQAQDTPADAIIVTASRIPALLQHTASSVTVITAEDIQANQWRTVAEALAAQPGMRVAASGGVGAQTSVFTRGTNSNHTLVLIDGVEVSDPSTPNGAYDFAHLNLNNVDRIEIVRGPQSTLYGSGALGGVIHIISKRGDGSPKYTASAEGGSFHTYSERLAGRARESHFHYSLGMSQLNTAGQSITPERLRAGQPNENDGYRNTTFTFQGGVMPGSDTEINLGAKTIHAHSQLDIGAGEDPDSESSVTQRFARLEAKSSFADGRWKPTLGYSRTRQLRQTVNERQSALGDEQHTQFLGESSKADFQNQFIFSPNHILFLGYETKKDSMTAAGTSAFGSSFGDFIQAENTDVQERLKSWFLEEQIPIARNFRGTMGLRSDNYASFPTAKTWRVTPLYTIPDTATKLKASVGTAFRAPSLFERHGSTPTNFGTAFNGNPSLKPEENRGWEIGVEQTLDAGRIEPRFTYYRNRITNLIKTVFLPSFDSTSVNIDRAITEGYESGVAWRLSDRAALQIEYTRTRTLDQNGQELLRRPREIARVEARSNLTAEVEVTSSLGYTGRRKDVDRVSGAVIETGGYTVTNLAALWRLSKNVRAHGRIENLLDKTYEPIDGFQGIRRAIYAGIEASF